MKHLSSHQHDCPRKHNKKIQINMFIDEDKRLLLSQMSLTLMNECGSFSSVYYLARCRSGEVYSCKISDDMHLHFSLTAS